MRALAASLSQLAMTGAVLATLLYVPAGIALALAFGLFGVPLETFVTFNGALEIYEGLCAWWLLAFGAGLAGKALSAANSAAGS